MSAYISRRLLTLIPIVIGITFITFLMMHLSPGSPADIYEFSAKVSSDIRERFRKLYGLDKPFHVQYFNWLKKVAVFDFGRSFKDDRPVMEKIFERLPITLLLNVCAMLIIILVAIPLGIISAVYKEKIVDKLITVFVFLGYSIPHYWLALLLMILFGIKLGLLPISGIYSVNHDEFTFMGKVWDVIKHITLPVLISAFGGLAGMSRYVKMSMLDVLTQDYVKYAYAKGLPKNVVVCKHSLRNALIPVITILGLSVPGLIGGSFIFETIFAIPGIGRLGYEAIMARDYPIIMGLSIITAFLTLLGNLIADIAYAYADPRIRYR